MSPLADIKSREGKIECKVKPGFIPGLLRLKPSELFYVAYAKLNQKADAPEALKLEAKILAVRPP